MIKLRVSLPRFPHPFPTCSAQAEGTYGGIPGQASPYPGSPLGLGGIRGDRRWKPRISLFLAVWVRSPEMTESPGPLSLAHPQHLIPDQGLSLCSSSLQPLLISKGPYPAWLVTCGRLWSLAPWPSCCRPWRGCVSFCSLSLPGAKKWTIVSACPACSTAGGVAFSLLSLNPFRSQG